MSATAGESRSARRAMAMPNCAREKLMHAMARFLPGGAGAIVAVMVVTPMFNHDSVSFLLDRNKVAMTQDRLSIRNAAYREVDNRGRAFALSASSAVQKSAHDPVVRMKQLAGSIELTDGTAHFSAPSGDFDVKSEHLNVPEQVQLDAANGTSMTIGSVDIDVRHRMVAGQGGVTGQFNGGNFSARQIAVDLDARKVSLMGRAHMHMVPGAKGFSLSPPGASAPVAR
jgi:lipopolysaccharide export system protein LptC